MKNAVGGQHYLSLALALMLVASSAGLIMTGGASSGDSASGYYRVDVRGAADVDALRSAGAEVVEDYGVFAIVKMPATLKSALGKSHNIELFTDATLVKFNGYEFDVTKGEPAFPSDLILSKQPDYSGFYLVKFLGPIKTSWTDDMERVGAKNYGPAGPSTFLVGMTSAQKAQVASQPHVLWVGDYQPAYKVSDMFSGATGKQTVNVLTYPELQGSAKGRIARIFQQTGLGEFFEDYTIPDTVSNGTTGYIRAVVDASIIPEIAKITGVQYIEKFEQPKPTNAYQHSEVQTGAYTSVDGGGPYGPNVPVWNAGILGQTNPQTGQPMVLGSADTGIRLDHDMFRQGTITNANWDTSNGYAEGNYNFSVTTHRKIVRYAIGEQTGWDKTANTAPDHGTHMICTAVGFDNPVSGTNPNDGQAPGAKISFYDVGTNDATSVFPPPDYSTMWNLAKTDGARVYSTTWGSPYQTSYTADMKEIDQYMYDNQKFQVIWGGGNEGTGANTVGQQAESKNVIAVGVYNDGTNAMNQASMNSNGPTYDGRLKPDIMAPGTATTSANSAGTNTYTDMMGASSAESNAAGAALLLNQYFLTGFYPTGAAVVGNQFDPSAALIKAIFINGCEQMTGSVRAYNNGNGAGLMNYPNCAQGWGRVDLDNSLYFSSDALKLQVVDADNGVETGDFIEYKYRLTDAAQNFKTTLCWSDYPGVIGTGAALVNDLDLLVTSPTGVPFKGNIFTGTIGSCYTPGNSAFAYDHRNNVEEVWVRAADTSVGEWTVRVTGYNVPKAVQPFGLVMTGSLDPAYGTVQMDRDIYGVGQTATIRIEDSDAGPGPLPVVVSSAVAGKTETVSCSMTGTGVYVGYVGFTLDFLDPAGNGILPVLSNDGISARYDDVSGTIHSAYGNSTIDGYGPTITNVHTGLISMSSAEIKWTTSEQANATVYYGTNPASLTGIARSNSPYTTSPQAIVYGLTVDTLYYYDVESSDAHGNKVRATNGGSHFTFTTQSRADILLFINGGTGYDYNLMIQKYEWAMANKGWTYNVMTSWNDGNPSLATLQLYKVVLFQPGLEQYPQFSAAQRTLVTSYLNAGGRFFTTSHDTMWALGDETSGYGNAATNSWTNSQLHSNWLVDPATFTQIRCGVAGDPISGGYVGGITYQGFRSGGYGDEITAVAAGHTVTYVWQNSGGAATPGYIGLKSVSNANNGTAGVGVYGGTPSRVVNYAFEWSCIVDNFTIAAQTRADILDLTIRWLIGHDHPDVTVAAPNGGETVTSTTTVTWTRSVASGYSVGNQAIYYSPNNGSAWYLAAQTPTIPVNATAYVWNVSGLPKGNQYLVKVVVYDDGVPVPPLGGSDKSNAAFTINSNVTPGPLVQPGSLKIVPNSVLTGQTCWINATIDDTSQARSNIVQAEYFIDVIGGNGAGTAMSAVTGYNSPVVTVTWQGILSLTQGTHTVYVHGRDSAGNWGPMQSSVFMYNSIAAPSPFFNVTVVAGWNFISFPMILQNETLPTALLDKTPGVVWTRAMWYDPMTPTDPWKQYNTFWNSALNDLKAVDHTMSLWLYVTSVGDGVLCLGGAGSREPGDTMMTLRTGWNMIGFPSQPMTVAAFKATIGATIVEGFNGTQLYQTSVLADSATMSAGHGYWVQVPADVAWNAHYGAPTPYMRLSKTAPATASTGQFIVYSLSYSNIGNTASNVVVTEIYPAGVSFVSSMPAPSMGNNVWNIGSVSSGGSGTITVTVMVLPGYATITNVASLDYTDSGATPMPTRRASASTNVVPGAVHHIVVAPNPVTVTVGEIQQFSAIAYDVYNNVIPGVNFIWTTNVGVVNSTGMFTAQTVPGVGTVSASSGAKSGSATINIIPRAVHHIVVVPNPLTIAVGQHFPPCTAIAFDIYNNIIPGVNFTWTTNLNLDGNGTIIPPIPPNPWINVSAGNITVSVVIVVVPGTIDHIVVSPNPATVALGGTQWFTAAAYDVYNNVITGVTFTWTTNVGTITSSGYFTAGTIPGVGFVNATSGSVTGSASVTVGWGPGTIAYIVVTPNPATVTVGGAQQFSAVAYDMYANVIPGVVFTWTTNVGSVNATGYFTAQGTPATGWVRATNGSVTGTATVNVTGGDITPPAHSNESPPVNGHTGDSSPSISVHVTDMESGVSAGTMRLYIDGFNLFYDSAAIANGYNISYQYGGNYTDGKVVACRLVARDYANNLLDYSWSFTVDISGPTVNATVPNNGGTNVLLATPISVTFSEAVDHASAESAFSMVPSANGTFSWQNDTMTFTPSASLAGLIQYNVTVATGVMDTVGNHMTVPYTFSFTTGSGADVTPPQHSQEAPAPNGTATNTTPLISVDVTDPSGVNASSIRLYVQGYSVFFELEVVAGGYRVKYWHEPGFAHGTVVSCRIVARDTLGNLLDYTWTFTVP